MLKLNRFGAFPLRSVCVPLINTHICRVIFCNRCGLVLYQTKSKHGLYFPLDRRFLNQIKVVYYVET